MNNTHNTYLTYSFAFCKYFEQNRKSTIYQFTDINEKLILVQYVSFFKTTITMCAC